MHTHTQVPRKIRTPTKAKTKREAGIVIIGWTIIKSIKIVVAVAVAVTEIKRIIVTISATLIVPIIVLAKVTHHHQHLATLQAAVEHLAVEDTALVPITIDI